MRKKKFPEHLGVKNVKHVLLRFLGTKKWRTELLCSKCPSIAEDEARKEIRNCKNIK
jgi:hypothetical protein